MKSKRFKDNSILPKGFRKLSCELKATWDYLWMNCDESGVWEIDEDLFGFENNFEFNQDEFLNSFNGLVDIYLDKILLKDFIRINNGEIRDGYNPHKPVLRQMEQNSVKLNISLNQAYFKLGDGDRDRDVGEGVGFEKSEKLLKKVQDKLNIEIYPTFEDFWNDYDKKTGSIKKLKPKWDKLTQSNKEKIMHHIPDYKKSQPDKRFRKNPETFLNNESWNDEIINNNEQSSSDKEPTINRQTASVIEQNSRGWERQRD